MSATGSESFDFDSISESDDVSQSSGSSDDESDLQDLYESFEFEEVVPRTHLPANVGARLPSALLTSASAVAEGQLYPGSDLSTFQCYLLVFQYAIRHSLTTKAFTELLQLLAVHLPRGAAVPRSVHNLKRFFVDCFPESQSVRHYYCTCCQRPLPSDSSRCQGHGCSGGSSAEFITIPAGAQLKRMMEDPTTWSALQERFSKHPDHSEITDIYDGEGYKQHADFLAHPAHVSFILNTDGVALYRSSSVSIWPVWAIVNEFPPGLRFKRQHMLLLGIFYSSNKPLMNMYLRPIMDDLITLFRDGMPHPLSSLGVPVDTPAGTMVSRAILLACSVDLPARAMICNMKQWNGAHGCLYCEEAGTTIGADHLHRYWPYKPTTPRSHASLLHNAECAIRNGTPVCGVKGATVLALHPTFNIVHGVVVDDLHGLFLGVTLTLLHLWLDRKSRNKPFFIGNKVKECDQRLLSICVTHSMSRIPRSLEEFTHWKGAELRNWLLFYSLPVLHDILPQQYFCHLALLVATIYIYSSEKISLCEHQQGQQLLLQFYKEFSEHYGVACTTMNVHLLYHLSDCVRMWGPLWAYSCFHFESMNGYLKFLFHGTKDMTKQMAFSYIIMQALPQTVGLFSDSPHSISTFANLLYGKKKILRQAVTPDVFVVGGISMKVQHVPCVIAALTALLETELPAGLLPTVYRAEYKGQLYFSRQYSRVKKRNSYTVIYCDGGRQHFAIVDSFVMINNRLIAILLPLIPHSLSCKEYFNLSTVVELLSHLIPVTKGNSFKCCFIEQFVCTCLFIDFGFIQYIAKFPSTVMFD